MTHFTITDGDHVIDITCHTDSETCGIFFASRESEEAIFWEFSSARACRRAFSRMKMTRLPW